MLCLQAAEGGDEAAALQEQLDEQQQEFNDLLACLGQETAKVQTAWLLHCLYRLPFTTTCLAESIASACPQSCLCSQRSAACLQPELRRVMCNPDLAASAPGSEAHIVLRRR